MSFGRRDAAAEGMGGRQMKVYYGTNFYGPSKDGEEMRKKEINREFKWGNLSGFLPAVYIGKEGMAADICIRVAEDRIREFYGIWQHRMEEGMSRAEYEQALEENPLNIDFELCAWVNGEKLQSSFSCGTSYSVIFMEESGGCAAARELMLEYGCKEEYGWCIRRHMFAWEKEPERLNCIDLEFIGLNKDYRDMPIEIGAGDAGRKYAVTNPLSQKQYEVWIKGTEWKEIPLDFLKASENQKISCIPNHYLLLTYSVEPDLHQEKFRLQDISDGGAGSSQDADGMENAIIGGAYGPTAIFLAGRKKVTEDRLAVSVLYACQAGDCRSGLMPGGSAAGDSIPAKASEPEPVRRIKWVPVFSEKERQDMRLHIEL